MRRSCFIADEKILRKRPSVWCPWKGGILLCPWKECPWKGGILLCPWKGGVLATFMEQDKSEWTCGNFASWNRRRANEPAGISYHGIGEERMSLWEFRIVNKKTIKLLWSHRIFRQGEQCRSKHIAEGRMVAKNHQQWSTCGHAFRYLMYLVREDIVYDKIKGRGSVDCFYKLRGVFPTFKMRNGTQP